MKHRKDRFDYLNFFPKGGRCAEIGVAKGDYAAFILERLDPEKLFLIDCWEKRKEGLYTLDAANEANHDLNLLIVKDRFDKEIRSKRVKILKEYYSDILFTFPDGFFDWVYCDADQTYDGVRPLLDALDECVSLDGYICGDDYCVCPDLHFGVIPAVEEFCDKKNWNMVAITGEEMFRSYALKRNVRTDNNSVVFVFGKTDDIESVHQAIISLKTDLEWQGDICVVLDRDSSLYRSYFEDKGIFFLNETREGVLRKIESMSWDNVHFVSTGIVFTEVVRGAFSVSYSDEESGVFFETIKSTGDKRNNDFFGVIERDYSLEMIAKENVKTKLRSYIDENIYREIKEFNTSF